jgi:hypothetical protein
MDVETEFLKFEPTPKGSAKYDDNKDGFFLAGPPFEQVMSQGSGSGAKVNRVTFLIKADRGQFDMFGALAANNSKKSTKVTHTSLFTVEGERKELGKTTYEQITFVGADGIHTGGERYQNISVTCTYVKKDRKASDYGDDGKVLPSFLTKIDLSKGTIKGS